MSLPFEIAPGWGGKLLTIHFRSNDKNEED